MKDKAALIALLDKHDIFHYADPPVDGHIGSMSYDDMWKLLNEVVHMAKTGAL